MKIAYRQFGSGPDLLLVMGEHGTMTWWDPQLLVDLGAHFTVTIFDLPGVGYSEALPGAASVESYADATAGLAYSLHLLAPVVLGWGLGGAVALSLAERHPALAARLVVVDPLVGGGTPTVVAASAGAFASAHETLAALSADLFDGAAPALRAAYLARVAELSPDDIVASGVGEEATAVRALAGDRLVRAGLRTLDLPVLVVSGGADVVAPPADAALVATSLRHRELWSLPDAGYGLLSEVESQFVTRVTSFATPSST